MEFESSMYSTDSPMVESKSLRLPEYWTVYLFTELLNHLTGSAAAPLKELKNTYFSIKFEEIPNIKLSLEIKPI